MNNNKAGAVGAVLLGAWHAAWSALVALGLAQALLDWIFWLHFLSNPYHVEPFSTGRAALLVAFTALVGYAAGWVFAAAWNALSRA